MKLYYVAAKKASSFSRDAVKNCDNLSQLCDQDRQMNSGQILGCGRSEARLGGRKCTFSKKFSRRSAESVQISIVLRCRICYNKQK